MNAIERLMLLHTGDRISVQIATDIGQILVGRDAQNGARIITYDAKALAASEAHIISLYAPHHLTPQACVELATTLLACGLHRDPHITYRQLVSMLGG